MSVWVATNAPDGPDSDGKDGFALVRADDIRGIRLVGTRRLVVTVSNLEGGRFTALVTSPDQPTFYARGDEQLPALPSLFHLDLATTLAEARARARDSSDPVFVRASVEAGTWAWRTYDRETFQDSLKSLGAHLTSIRTRLASRGHRV